MWKRLEKKGTRVINVGDRVKIISILAKGTLAECIVHTSAEVMDVNYFLELYHCLDYKGNLEWHHLHDLLHPNSPPLPVGLHTCAPSSIKDPDVKPYETRQDYEINKRRRELEEVDYEKMGEDFAKSSEKTLTDKEKKDIINNIYGGF